MTSELLSLLESRLKNGFYFLEVQQGEIVTHREVSGSVEDYGNYILAQPKNPREVWNCLWKALQTNKPLVILPRCTHEEKMIFLRQIPTSPPKDSLLVLFTSGSTGQAKSVFHSEPSLLASAAQLWKAFPHVKMVANTLAPWGMAGIAFSFLLPLQNGEGVLSSPESIFYWQAQAPELFLRAKIDLIASNPTLLTSLFRNQPKEPWKWAGSIVTLTAPLKSQLRSQVEQQCKGELIEIYGMTEAAGPVLCRGESLGSSLRINADDELEINGPQLFLGYGTEGVFTSRSVWFSTGDRFTHENKYNFQSRLRDLIDIGGRKIAPRMIEEIIESVPEISECTVFGFEENGVERPGLLYVKKEGAKGIEDKIRERMKLSLSQDLWIHRWREVAALPKNRAGKIDRAEAQKLLLGL